MDTWLILHNVRVENANAINGITWGFPAISHFLGFTHALERQFTSSIPLQVMGCGVICHQHTSQAYKSAYGDRIFSQTRNPLTKEGETAPFNEEGRMHMTVSLVMSCKGIIEPVCMVEAQSTIEQLALSLRVAGGTIIRIGKVTLNSPPENEEGNRVFERKLLKRLLPGFALVQRSDLMPLQLESMTARDSKADVLDAWLAFSSVRYEAAQSENISVEEKETPWSRVSRAGEGWIVPLALGYRGISPLYEPNTIQHARDNTVPFRYVESVYSVGQWVSPHRLETLQDLIWTYSADPEEGWYLYTNSPSKLKTLS